MFFTSASRDTGAHTSRIDSASRAQPTPVKFRKLLEGVSLWLLVVLFLSLHPVYAEATESREDPAGALYFGDHGSRGEQATLLSADYQVTVSGLVAETRLRQSFSNTGQSWREAIYVFPLPEQASVYSLKMKAGERVIEGEIQTRQEAAARYETAKAEGRQAATVAQERPNLFTTRLANVPPGEQVTVEIRYQQAVRYQSGEFELRLPTTLTPRYIPGMPLVNSSPATWRQGWATQVADADASEAPSAAVFHERWQGEDYLLALLVPGVERGERLVRELVFVIDTSGSMGGKSIRQPVTGTPISTPLST